MQALLSPSCTKTGAIVFFRFFFFNTRAAMLVFHQTKIENGLMRNAKFSTEYDRSRSVPKKGDFQMEWGANCSAFIFLLNMRKQQNEGKNHRTNISLEVLYLRHSRKESVNVSPTASEHKCPLLESLELHVHYGQWIEEGFVACWGVLLLRLLVGTRSWTEIFKILFIYAAATFQWLLGQFQFRKTLIFNSKLFAK